MVHRTRSPWSWVLPFTAIAVSSCTGSVSSPAAPAGPGGAGAPARHDDPTDSTSAPLTCADDAPRDPGPAPLRMLSRAQYVNTLRALFGDRGDVAGVFDALPAPSAFGLVQPDVSQLELEQFEKAANTIAARVVADRGVLGALVPCSGGDRRACAGEFITRFAKRAYRAPLRDGDDLARHLALYDVGARTSHEHGVELVLQGMLQAPRFLYHVELGTDERVTDDAVALSGQELAARLAYTFWQRPPDDELVRAAEAGELSDPDALEAQLVRMLAHEDGRYTLRSFLESYVQLPALERLVKDPALYPEWNGELSAALRDQARAFFDHVLGEEDGALAALLTSNAVFANDKLTAYYDAAPSGDSFTRVQLPDARTSGLLTLPALLAIQAKADESSPIHRGRFVREVMLCQELPKPPANIPKPPEVSAGASTRERAAQHEADPACSGCHRLLDPLGFGFEHFDAIGRYRSSDGGKPVDARGELVASRDAAGTFDGVRELGERLAQSDEVEECMTRQWFRFALGRFEQPVDACTVDDLHGALSREAGSLHALPRALVRSAAFRTRRPHVVEEP